jgi:putative lipoprotein
MRKLVLSLTSLAALVLAGCNASPSSQQNGAGVAASGSAASGVAANVVSGTVALREPAQLSPKASLVISLVNVSSTAQSGTAPLASKTVSPVTTFPQSFELTFDPAKVNPSDLYVVKAQLTDGERQYTMPLQAPVLTNGAKNEVSIQLVAEQTAAEKDLAAFNSLEQQIGGMMVKSGTKLGDGVSRGWQIFRQAGDIKFIRELVDYGDKGFTSTDFAYRDGKPWAAVQQKKASRTAKPTSTDSASWAENGTLVLKLHESDGKTETLDSDTASSLHQQAVSILSLATGGKNK